MCPCRFWVSPRRDHNPSRRTPPPLPPPSLRSRDPKPKSSCWFNSDSCPPKLSIARGKSPRPPFGSMTERRRSEGSETENDAGSYARSRCCVSMPIRSEKSYRDMSSACVVRRAFVSGLAVDPIVSVVIRTKGGRKGKANAGNYDDV